MGPFWIKWLLPLLLLQAKLARGSPSVLPVLNYPANPSFLQAHGHFLPLPSTPTTYTTQTLGLPVLTSQSSFFLKSLPSLVNTATPLIPLPHPPAATPLVPLPTASATPLLPLPAAPATPLVPIPTASASPLLPLPASSSPIPQPPSRSVPVPTLLIYSDGTVVPLSDTHYKFPPVIEGFINRVQNYFSNYVQIDPNSVPFPIKNQKLSTAGSDNSSTAAITTTTTTTTTAKTFGPAINLRFIAAPNNQQHQPTVGFTRTSTVPTSTGRTAKLVEVFRPSGQLSGALTQSNDDNQTPLAIATATATVNFDGSDPNRPNPEFGSNQPQPNRPEQPNLSPNRPEQPNLSPNQPEQPNLPPNRPNQPPQRPRPARPQPGPRPEQGYRYDRPVFRPLEYGDVPPKPEAYRFKGSF